jgi:hypothetical protein
MLNCVNLVGSRGLSILVSENTGLPLHHGNLEKNRFIGFFVLKNVILKIYYFFKICLKTRPLFSEETRMYLCIKVLEMNLFSAVKYVHGYIVFNRNLMAEILILVRLHAVSKVPEFEGFLLWLLVGFFS